MAGVFPLIRLACFGFVLVCSLIVLGITANFVSLSNGTATSSTGLGLATSVISLVLLSTATAVSLIRTGSFVTVVWVELAEVGLLWVLWLATAAQVSNVLGSGLDCSILSILNPEAVSICRQGQAFQAFSWLAWITLTIYFGLLLSFSIIANSRGNTNVWSSSVVDTDFLAPGNSNNFNQDTKPHTQHSVAPMMHQQQQYPPQQTQLYTQPAAATPQLGSAGTTAYQSPQITGGSYQHPPAQPTPGSIPV